MKRLALSFVFMMIFSSLTLAQSAQRIISGASSFSNSGTVNVNVGNYSLQYSYSCITANATSNRYITSQNQSSSVVQFGEGDFASNDAFYYVCVGN